MAITLDKNYFKPLDDFFANKTIHDVNRDAYLVCNLHDKTYNIHISLVFLRDWDSLESDSFNQVILRGKGAVFTFPCYWISVPKELAFEYFTYIIQTFYNDEVSGWFNTNTNDTNNNIGGTNTNIGNSSCICNNSYTNNYPPCSLNI